jgi:hypothetical protein
MASWLASIKLCRKNSENLARQVVPQLSQEVVTGDDQAIWIMWRSWLSRRLRALQGAERPKG